MLYNYEDKRCPLFDEKMISKINILKSYLLPHMITVKNEKEKQDLTSFFYVSSGFVSVYRKNEDVLLGHLHAPIFFGVNYLYDVYFPVYFTGGVGAVIYKGEVDVLLKVIRENHLEECLLYVMISNVNELYRRDLISGKSDSYQIIKSILLHYIDKPLDFRMQFGIASIIIKLTGLSRSHVMRILSELKKGGYIETKEGKLISVSDLPEKF